MRFGRVIPGVVLLLLAACSTQPGRIALDETFVSFDEDFSSVGVAIDGESYWIAQRTESGCSIKSFAFASREVVGERFEPRCPEPERRGEKALRIEKSDLGERIVRVGVDETVRAVTGYFDAIDSFDTSPGGEEVVFSARRDGGFDVAIVSIDGESLNWVFPQSVDEKLVTWAPRGNKITMVMETPDGSILRTVHVPTGASLSVEQRTRSGMIVIRMEEAMPDREFWDAVSGLSWVDQARVFIVSEHGNLSAPAGRATLVEPSNGAPGEVRLERRLGTPVARIGLGEGNPFGPWAARFVIKTLGSGADEE